MIGKIKQTIFYGEEQLSKRQKDYEPYVDDKYVERRG